MTSQQLPERHECASRYITSVGSVCRLLYFQAKKKGETLRGELLLNGKPQKTITLSVFPTVHYFSFLSHSG
jgi:hypothetical protein